MENGFLEIVWDFNPTFFHIGSLDVRYYGLTWALTFIFGILYYANFAKREGLSENIADSVFWYGATACIIGSRLGHCLFYEPEFYLTHPIQILNLRAGGMASHGAALGLLVGLWLFSRKNKLPYIWSLDRVVLPVTIGGAMVRLGNLFNSEIYGVETDLPWGFVFVRAGETVAKHPTQLYEALCYFLLWLLMLWLYYKKNVGTKYPGMMFGLGLIGIFVSRFFIEYIKNPQVEFEEGMTLLMGQWLSIPFIIIGAVVVFYAFKAKELDLSAARAIKHKEDVAAAKKNKKR